MKELELLAEIERALFDNSDSKAVPKQDDMFFPDSCYDEKGNIDEF